MEHVTQKKMEAKENRRTSATRKSKRGGNQGCGTLACLPGNPSVEWPNHHDRNEISCTQRQRQNGNHRSEMFCTETRKQKRISKVERSEMDCCGNLTLS